jgi:hypothetical protein
MSRSAFERIPMSAAAQRDYLDIELDRMRDPGIALTYAADSPGNLQNPPVRGGETFSPHRGPVKSGNPVVLHTFDELLPRGG